MILFIKKYH